MYRLMHKAKMFESKEIKLLLNNLKMDTTM